MKLKNTFILTAMLCAFSLQAQTYQIQNVSHDTLITGESTELTITLNKEITDYDSIVVFVSGDNGYGNLFYDTIPTWTDSTLISKIKIPYQIENQEADLSIEMINTTDWSYENISFSESLTIKHIPYQIFDVSPDTLKVGSNKLTITLDRKIEYYDSILLDFNVPSLGNIGSGDNISWNDSIITASLYVAHAALNKEGTVRLSLNNNTDWTSEDVISEPIFVQSAEAGQKYNIQKVEPQNLKAGNNTLTITLNEEIVDFDSISVRLDGPSWEYSYWADVVSWNDSTITATVLIPDDVVNLEVELGISLVDKAYWVTEDLVYDKALIIAGGIYGISPEICMVSADEQNRHTIVWEPFREDYIDSVIVYKETQVAEEFERIGAKAISETPVFVDETSAKAPNSNRYKISVKDNSETTSDLGPAHKTMHLTMNVGLKGAINLIWEKYEGFEYSTFHIYRGSSKDNMTKIAEIASNLFTFTDQNPSLFKLYYQVVIEKADPCDISMQKSTADDYGSVKSNIVEHNIVNALDDAENEINNVKVYPNPVSDRLYISVSETLSSTFDITIHDITGKSVREYYSVGNYESIDLSGMESGLYFVHVQSNILDQTVRIIVE